MFFYSFFSLVFGFLCWLFWQAHDLYSFPRLSWVPPCCQMSYHFSKTLTCKNLP